MAGSDTDSRGPSGKPGLAVTMAMLGLAAGLALTSVARAQGPARVAAGEDAWDKAGCFECHGTAGEGGTGGEFPAGPSLRRSRLDRTALMETIGCGRPGTPMPAWLDGAYTERACYGLPKGPAPSSVVLTPVLSADEIQALLDFLMAKIVGQ
jgi:mono/diheme cytochrome c family protein